MASEIVAEEDAVLEQHVAAAKAGGEGRGPRIRKYKFFALQRRLAELSAQVEAAVLEVRAVSRARLGGMCGDVWGQDPGLGLCFGVNPGPGGAQRQLRRCLISPHVLVPPTRPPSSYPEAP